jgi:halimadienyl-diphosphate synthase
LGVLVTIDDGTPIEAMDVAAAVRELLAGLVAEPWGQVSPSVYETGRLVTFAPWLTGHAQRVDFLAATQRHDGGWGGPGGYALVPTLSATEAILTTLRRWTPRTDLGVGYMDLVRTADTGLRALFCWLDGPGELAIPDMPAVELIVPSLIALINQHLDALQDSPLTGIDQWLGGGPLHLPAGMDDTVFSVIHSRLGSGADVPEKLLHALEVAGDVARGLRTVRPVPMGTIGASPAATAAWLGDRGLIDPDDPARRYLERAVRAHAGPVPCGFPITVFEQGWVLSGLTRAGIPLTVPRELVESLESALGPDGTPAGPGLPADADTTAVALHALALLGAPRAPDALWAYEMETHFCTWPGEQGSSVTTNAHVLEAFGAHFNSIGRRQGALPDTQARYAAVVEKLSAWLCEQQQPDGSWFDRWHASPYYATACCALALGRFGGAGSQAAVRMAVRWVLATQREDGSWGRWRGTAEETAYAMHILLLARAPQDLAGQDRSRKEALARGHAHLLRSIRMPDDPPLWHDKDLYLPIAIVRSAVLAAVHLAQCGSAVSYRGFGEELRNSSGYAANRT